ncbi:MAG: calcium-binding protein [Pirellulaceae bacterium]
MGTLQETDFAATVLPPEGDFLAILVDTLDGEDQVFVGETVQKSVWVDAGAGDDLVRMEPRLAYLPDISDPVSGRNDTPAGAYPLGSLTTDIDVEGLTIDSAEDVYERENSEVDWFSFSLSAAPKAGDLLRISEGVGRFVPTDGNGKPGTDINTGAIVADRKEQNLQIQLFTGIEPAWNSLGDYSGAGNVPFSVTIPGGDMEFGSAEFETADDRMLVNGRTYNLVYAADPTEPLPLTITPTEVLKMNYVGDPAKGPIETNAVDHLLQTATAYQNGSGAYIDLQGLSANTTYYVRVLDQDSVTGGYSIAYQSVSTPDTYELASANTSPSSPHRFESPSSLDRIENLTLPAITGATNEGDWFEIPLASPAGTVSVSVGEDMPNRIVTLHLVEKGSLTELVFATTQANDPPATIDFSTVAGLSAGDYLLRVSADGPARYTLSFDIEQVLTGIRSAAELVNVAPELARIGSAFNPFALPSLEKFASEVHSISAPANNAPETGDLVDAAANFYTFTLSERGTLGEAIGLRNLDSDAKFASPENLLRIQLLAADGRVLQENESSDADPQTSIDLAGVEPGTYRIRVDAVRRFDQLQGDPSEPVFEALASANSKYEIYSATGLRVQRDKSVVDARQSVSRSLSAPQTIRRDVILGGDGDDALLGGSGEDWIFGGRGDDRLSGGYDDQAEDLIFGGEGNDYFIVLPDNLTLDNGVRKDLGNSDLFVGGETGDGYFDQVFYVGGSGGDFVTLGFDRFLGRHKISTLVFDTDTGNFVSSDGQHQQLYSFFRAINIDRTVVDAGAGTDIIHADPGYLLGGESWGISGGDLAAGATAFRQLMLVGGEDTDLIIGGAGDETIVGGNLLGTDDQGDFLAGGLGDDFIQAANSNEGGGLTYQNYLYGGRFEFEDTTLQGDLSIQEVLLFTPDSGVIPHDSPLAVNTYNPIDKAFNEVGSVRREVAILPVDGNAGVSFPIEADVPQILSFSFALEGINPASGGQQNLQSIVSVGDFNGDGLEDFLAYGASGQSFVLFGPVQSSALSRITTTPKVTQAGRAFATFRTEDWFFEREYTNNPAMEDDVASLRAGGRADQLLVESLGRFVASGNLIGNDDTSDLVFATIESGNLVLKIVAGATSSSRQISSVAKTITLPLTDLETNLDSLSVVALDWDGTNGEGHDELVVVGTPIAHATDVNAERTAGYIFSGATLNTSVIEFNASHASIHIKTDTTDRQSLVSVAAAQQDPPVTWTATTSNSNLRVSAVGDVNQDGFEDLVLGDSTYVVYIDSSDPIPGTNVDEAFGRVYLALGGRSLANSQTPVSLLANPGGNYDGSLSHYVWQGRGLGADVFVSGDTNFDGASDFGFTRNYEDADGNSSNIGDQENARGSVFVIGGTPKYKPDHNYLNTTGFINPLQAVDDSEDYRDVNSVLGILTKVTSGKHAIPDQFVTLGDFDGDSRTDLVVTLSTNNSNRPHVYYSCDEPTWDAVRINDQFIG